MANGDILVNVRNSLEAKLLDAQSATSTGAWIEVPRHLNVLSVSTTTLEEGAADAVVDIHVSNATPRPADATAGEDTWIQLKTGTPNIFSNEGIGGYKYVKAVKTAGTTPIATTVYFVATPSR